MIKTAADVARLFQLSGLVLKFDAAEFLFETLSAINKQTGKLSDDSLVDFVENVKRSPSAAGSLPLVDQRLCEIVFNENYKQKEDQSGPASTSRAQAGSIMGENDDDFVVISAFDTPRFTFDHERGRYARLTGRPDPFPGRPAEAKIDLYVNRYWILMDRLRRSEVFAPSNKNEDDEKKKRFVLTTVECLLGSTVDKEAAQNHQNNQRIVVVFGLLTRMKDGNWHLEDPTGFVKLDLTSASFQSGLLAEHCFVLAEGRYDDGDAVFIVRGLGLPPPESAATSRSLGPCGDVNMFGGAQHSASVVQNTLLAERARLNQDAMAVIVSDVWLDVRAVVDKLRLLFAGYADSPPFAFILFGNFLSTHYGERQSAVFREKFADFYAMLQNSFKTIIATSRFLFIPGGEDPGLADTLPRFPLLKCLLPSALISSPLVTLASNPCRLTWFNREIVLFRADLVQKLARHTVNCASISDTMPLAKHFIKTLASQAHICPLPVYVQPVSWPYDQALALNPMPDVCIVADRFSAYSEVQAGCRFTNCGSFLLSNFHFLAYYPYSNELEDCQVVELNNNNNANNTVDES